MARSRATATDKARRSTSARNKAKAPADPPTMPRLANGELDGSSIDTTAVVEEPDPEPRAARIERMAAKVADWPEDQRGAWRARLKSDPDTFDEAVGDDWAEAFKLAEKAG